MKNFLGIFLLLIATPVFSEDSVAQAFSSKRPEWLGKLLNYRYFIEFGTVKHLDEAKAYHLKHAQRENAYRDVSTIVEAKKSLMLKPKERMGYLEVLFDREAKVLSSHSANSPLVGRLAANGSVLALVPEKPDGDGRGYAFAFYFMGLPGDDETFSPSICHILDDSRYDSDWPRYADAGNFGCREWAYQLLDPDRPYIDVTSWYRGRARIGTWVGWSRFEDPPKPVIGKHGNRWYCLYECPPGEEPGLIPDIKRWTVRHGYPMPIRPKKQPMFPDSDFKNQEGEFEGCDLSKPAQEASRTAC